jgi:formylglycine-generating enzyme required for sulfatase activity
MRLIPKGTFMMGSPNSEAMRGDDELQHEVTISKDYYLGVHEVTQEQYQRVMRSNPSVFQKPRIRWDTSGRPVENVTWEDAEEFCKRLSEIPDEKKAGRVYRLPTEAEWEYACRAGTNTTFSFAEKGDLLPEYAWSHRHGWFELNSSGQTHAVGLKEPNAWGLYDMHGNVWEWCSDRYGEYPEEPVVDPQGPDRGSKRVMRGGSYLLGFEDLCRSASRFGSVATYRLADIGFRISMDFDKKPVTPPEPEGR